MFVWVTHFILLQHHEVEMLDSFQRIIPHSLLEDRWRDYVPDIFINKGIPGAETLACAERPPLRHKSNALGYILLRPQPITLQLRQDDLDVGVLSTLKPVRGGEIEGPTEKSALYLWF